MTSRKLRKNNSLKGGISQHDTMPKKDGVWKKTPFGFRTEHLRCAASTSGGRRKSQIRGLQSFGEIRRVFG